MLEPDINDFKGGICIADNGRAKGDILSVSSTREETRAAYDLMSGFYDLVAGWAEHPAITHALEAAHIMEGESVLEVGFGTGWAIEMIHRAVGESGRVCGIDLSAGMIEMTMRRLAKAGFAGGVELEQGDMTKMPYPDGIFDVVFSSFVIELLDTPEIPAALSEIRRVLKPGGRFVDVSMSKSGDGAMVRLYEWLHARLPRYVDCRPIYVQELIESAGFEVMETEMRKVMGLPVEIVVAGKG